MQNLKTKKVFTVRKYPAICGNKTNGANIAYGMSLVTIIFQFGVKKTPQKHVFVENADQLLRKNYEICDLKVKCKEFMHHKQKQIVIVIYLVIYIYWAQSQVSMIWLKP